MEFTAVIKKGDKQYVALCPELDVVSQGYTVEESLKNLKEAVGLYTEEFGVPEGAAGGEMIVTHFKVNNVKASSPVRS